MENIAILGASRGLGYQLACNLKSQAHLCLISRKVENITQEFEPQHVVKSFDFTKEQSWSEVIDLLRSQNVHRVFYVAGGGPHGSFALKDWKDHQWAYKLNFLFPSYLLHAGLKNSELFQQFIYVGSSVCEDQPDPKGASYCASKHAMKGLISSIQKEKPNLDVRLFSPGYMDTDMLPPQAIPRKNHMNLLSPKEVAGELWQWAQSSDGDRHKIIPSL